MTGRATMWTRRRGRVQTRWRTEEREHLGNLVKIEKQEAGLEINQKGRLYNKKGNQQG